ncbi:alpha/beta fold hydrolase [Permianibacter fluminis]|uniref:alpha/beta fold hydrolase n=1 Tax=Permianibacter fluminis TaxID=2738515 RepID=UPI001B7D7D48|nr:alpha/beta fold hydrolase [Permianibacter fluminis]
MKHWMRISLPIIAVGTQLLSGAAQADGPATPISKQGESCHLPNYEEPLRCVRINVPVDYAAPAGDSISLHVTVAPAFRETAKADPLFVLAGGPGQAGSGIVFLLDRAFKKVRATRDIVLIDQRGTGKSGKLDCDDLRDSETVTEAEQEALISNCLRNLKAPVQHYNTANAARDLDEVRKALGYAEVNVWGGSYGTRLGQAYARAFPDRVRALIIDGVAPKEQLLGEWGADAQHSLEAAFAHCEQDPVCEKTYPTLRADFRMLADNVEAGAVTLSFNHPRTAKPLSFVLPYSSFSETIRMMLYSAEMSARLPFLITESSHGNWKPFIAQMYASSDWSSDSMAIGLTLSVVCAEDMPRITPEVLAAEQTASFLHGLQLKQWPRWCAVLNVPAIPYSEPTPLATPTLLLSGALDPVTPPHRAETALKSLSAGQHLVAANVGHGVSHLGCGPKLLREFLDAPTEKIDGQCLNDIPLPPFVINVAGPAP